MTEVFLFLQKKNTCRANKILISRHILKDCSGMKNDCKLSLSLLTLIS